MEAGSTVAGRYTIESLLGRGGMGSVWVARDEKFGERIALKIASASGLVHEEWKARFVREARLGSRLGKTEGFVRAFDWGELPGQTLYLAMDLIPGARPLDLVAGSLEERLGRLRAAARLVATAHRAGVVHRDLKPANLLQGSDGKVSLADFGLAKVRGESESEAEGSERTGGLTASGVGMGTPAFMPPEQFEDTKRVDERADVYALGVMLFAALTGGRLPYDGSASAILQKQTRVALGAESEPRASELAPGTDARLEDLCRRAIALDKTKRLGSVDELLAGLDAYLTSGAVLTPTTTPAPSAAVAPASPVASPTIAPAPSSRGTPHSTPTASSPVPAQPPSTSSTPPERSGRIGAYVALGLVLALAFSWPRIEGYLDVLLATRPEPTDLLAAATPAPLPSASATPHDPSATPAPALQFDTLEPADGTTLVIGLVDFTVRGRLSGPGRTPVVVTEAGTPVVSAVTDDTGRFESSVHLGGPAGGRGRHGLEVSAGEGERRALAHFTVEVWLDAPEVTLEPIEPWHGGPLEVRARVRGARADVARVALVADGVVVEEASVPVGADGLARVVFEATAVPRATRELAAQAQVTDAAHHTGTSRLEVTVDRTAPGLEIAWPPAGFTTSGPVFVRARVQAPVARGMAFVAVDPGSWEIVTEAATDEPGWIHALVHLPVGEGPISIEVRAQGPLSDVAKARVVVQRVPLTVGQRSQRASGDPGLILGVGRARIVAVVVHSAASEAGLAMGDVIDLLDGEKVSGAEDVSAVLGSKKPGERTRVSYVRDGVRGECVLVAPEEKAPPGK